MSQLSQVWQIFKNYVSNSKLQKIQKNTFLVTNGFLSKGKIFNQPDKSVKFAQDNLQNSLVVKQLQKRLEGWTTPKNNYFFPTSENRNIHSKGSRMNQTSTAVQYIEQPELICSDRQLHAEIYDVLGTGVLTPEIVVQVMDCLKREPNFNPILLFQRLADFYSRWCRGEFIDAIPSDNLPQQKMMSMLAQNISLGLKQIDIYTGLNVLILLLELHRYAQAKPALQQQIIFYPSSKADTDNFFTSQLLRIIHYSDALKIGNFSSIVGEFLRGGNFQRTYLGDANLTGVNFSGADLSGAYLGDANLTGANLSHANLTGANFGDANLSGANLSGANLSHADFSSANLSGANLSHANLDRANFNSTDLSSSNLKNADLCYTDLSNANIKDANLSNADLSNAIIFGANLSDANLTNANFSNADLCRADLSGANLHHANLKNSNLSDTILFSSNLSNADLSNADLSYAKLNGANLSHTTLNGAILGGADFSDTHLAAIIGNDKQQWEGHSS